MKIPGAFNVIGFLLSNKSTFINTSQGMEIFSSPGDNYFLKTNCQYFTNFRNVPQTLEECSKLCSRLSSIWRRSMRQKIWSLDSLKKWNQFFPKLYPRAESLLFQIWFDELNLQDEKSQWQLWNFEQCKPHWMWEQLMSLKGIFPKPVHLVKILPYRKMMGHQVYQLQEVFHWFYHTVNSRTFDHQIIWGKRKY